VPIPRGNLKHFESIDFVLFSDNQQKLFGAAGGLPHECFSADLRTFEQNGNGKMQDFVIALSPRR
jgi:hypothetical protein